jgi:hypothetical protein
MGLRGLCSPRAFRVRLSSAFQDRFVPTTPFKIGPLTYLRVWAKIARSKGLATMWRVIRVHFEEKLAERGPGAVMRARRGWNFACAALGVAIVLLAPSPEPRATAGVDVARLAAFAAVTGLGVALLLRSLAMLLASFSANLLVHRFNVSFRPSVLRALALTVIAIAAARFAWPISGWVAAALLAVAWIVWPLLQHLVVAAKAPRHITHRLMPVDQLLAMSARKLPQSARRHVAVHEAGHVLFFGLGDRVPHDLFAWMSDELPPMEEVTSGESTIFGGAVSSFTALADKHLALDLHRAEFEALLGLTCGGAAAEEVVAGERSLGTIGDAADFEARARVFLSV